MQENNEKRNLKFCRYYHGEQQNPYRDSFKGRAWMAEQLAGERASDSAKYPWAMVIPFVALRTRLRNAVPLHRKQFASPHPP